MPQRTRSQPGRSAPAVWLRRAASITTPHDAARNARKLRVRTNLRGIKKGPHAEVARAAGLSKDARHRPKRSRGRVGLLRQNLALPSLDAVGFKLAAGCHD